MNKLPPVGDRRWQLAPHAHLIVYETADGGEFLTIYDCGAAQKPPSAKLIGNLVRVDAAHTLTRQPTGYIVKMREESTLVRQERAAAGDVGKQGDSDHVDHFVVRAEE